MSWEWTRDAACRGAPRRLADLATGTAGQQRAFIARFCRRCPVKKECLDYGCGLHGVYGGLTQKKREMA